MLRRAIVVLLVTGCAGGAEGAPAPVGAACEEAGRYVSRGGIAIDTAHQGRMWQRATDGVARPLPDARAYCASLTIDGVTGFRLPDRAELGSLVLRPVGIDGRADACLPAIDQSAFPATPRAEHWTSSARAPGRDAIPVEVDFADGRTHGADPGAPFFVRCVRSADGTDSAPSAK